MGIRINIIISKIILVLILFSFSLCNDSENSELGDEVTNRIGDVIKIPNVTQVLFNDSLYDNFNIGISKIKIITYIWGDCHVCISDIRKWEPMIKYANTLENIDILFVLFVTNIEYFKNNLYIEEMKNIPLIIDKDNNFITVNNIPFEQKHLQTFLLDSNNKVILVGNPCYNEAVENLYRVEIEKRITN